MKIWWNLPTSLVDRHLLRSYYSNYFSVPRGSELASVTFIRVQPLTSLIIIFSIQESLPGSTKLRNRILFFNIYFFELRILFIIICNRIEKRIVRKQKHLAPTSNLLVKKINISHHSTYFALSKPGCSKIYSTFNLISHPLYLFF